MDLAYSFREERGGLLYVHAINSQYVFMSLHQKQSCMWYYEVMGDINHQ